MSYTMFPIVALLMSLPAAAPVKAAAPETAPAQTAAAAPAYAVVVSRATHQQADWKPVVEALVQRHHAKVIEYDKQVGQTLDALKQAFPRYTCFVAQPAEASREFVAAVSDLARKLDDDPYTDTLWGILTGYTAQNALAIARHEQPLVVHRVSAGTQFALDCCEQGIWYDELVKNKVVYKKPGGEPNELRGPDDTTEAMAKALNEYRPDLFITSGHATERDWQLGFRYRNGQFRCAEGRLFGLDTGGKRHQIDSPNPKVYLPVGNCLMGHIDRPDCMALAWMNSAGVKQMIGYTVSTWFGYAGWGCLNYFVEQPGRYTFTEAFFANQQALIHSLESDAGDAATRKGLKFDSTVVAFYGDPAWQARMAAGKLAFEQSLSAADGRWTFEVKPKDANSFGPIDTNGSQRQPRPFLAFFDRRLKDVEVVEGADLKPVITDDFILVERPPACDPSKTYRVVFRARPIQ